MKWEGLREATCEKNISIADYSSNTIKKQAFESFTSGNINNPGISEQSKVQAGGLRNEIWMR